MLYPPIDRQDENDRYGVVGLLKRLCCETGTAVGGGIDCKSSRFHFGRDSISNRKGQAHYERQYQYG